MGNNQMLARIARAIAGTQEMSDWRKALPAAHAVLMAMREPTVPMLEAALADLPDWGNLPDDWRVMIDYAAGESLQ
jgi:hypothetical protein